ncbi:MAG: glycoside hydrolase family 2 protein [bacterium]
MEGALSIYRKQGIKTRNLTQWKYKMASWEKGEEQRFMYPDYSDSHWEDVVVPKLFKGCESGDTVWYRTEFSNPPLEFGKRLLLRFEGVFLEAFVWVNGEFLGSHDGYFSPFTFDITNYVVQGKNIVVLCARSEAERDLNAKRHPLGVFGDWDYKPYSSGAYPGLPQKYEWYTPLGLWRNIYLEEVGEIVFGYVHTTPVFRGDDVEVEVDIELLNLSSKDQEVDVTYRIVPHNFIQDMSAEGMLKCEVPAFASVHKNVRVPIKEPKLWWHWPFGDPNLYRLDLSVQGRQAVFASIRETFGLRKIEVEMGKGRWEFRLNGRRAFPKGSCYISDFMPDRPDEDFWTRDLNMARRGNIDLLRVYAHIEGDDFYRLADEMGMLIICDFPLIGGYETDLPEPRRRAFGDRVQRQLEEMVHLLYNHPSIIMWTVHSSPPWCDTGPTSVAGDGNRSLDVEGKRFIEGLDPTRPVMAASGEFDDRIDLGWKSGSWADLRNVQSAFPMEFGAQSLPNRDSPFWDDVETGWPVRPDDPSWLYAGYQPRNWIHRGVGPPQKFASLNDYIRRSQEYQGFLCWYAVEQLRIKKFRPTGGMVHYMLFDCHPAISHSVVDYYRRAKGGYYALRRAYNPTHVCIDPGGEFKVVDRRIHYEPGGSISFDLYITNDLPDVGGEATLHWSIRRERSDRRVRRPLVRSLRKSLQRFSLRGSIQVPIPAFDEPSRRVHTIQSKIPRNIEGRFVLKTTLSKDKKVIDSNEVIFSIAKVGTGEAETSVYLAGSLKNVEGGFAFAFRNTSGDFAIKRFLYFKVDGRAVDLDDVDVIQNGVTRPLRELNGSVPIALPRGENVDFIARSEPLGPGYHSLAFGLSLSHSGRVEFEVGDMLSTTDG